MTRAYYTFPVNDIDHIKKQVLSWGDRFSICCFLDNHQYEFPDHSLEFLGGVGSVSIFEPGEDFFSSLSAFVTDNTDWLFGHFNYDIKNKIEEGLASKNPDITGFPDSFLFVPEVVFKLENARLTIGVFDTDAEHIFSEILNEPIAKTNGVSVAFTERINKEEYLQTIQQLKKHIHHGDCYEINFCQEFYASAEIQPTDIYFHLVKISPNPFSAFYRIHDKYLLCASPERYLKKSGDKLISQPIKGTSARDFLSTSLDDLNKTQLRDSAKDKSENVMIVDLVRNDLSKICEEGSVKADELFGVYSFPNVHQMISTVSGILKKDKNFGDVLKATFPMGSMTGAPKRKVMELIEKYEQSKRGIYSGTVGYISPDKDFDFNVVIRSLVYNEAIKYLSFHTGSAITALSDPEKEYEECLLKGKAIVKVLS